MDGTGGNKMNQSKKKAPRKKLKAGLIALIGVFVLAVFVGIALAVVNSGAKGDDIAAQTTPSEFRKMCTASSHWRSPSLPSTITAQRRCA